MKAETRGVILRAGDPAFAKHVARRRRAGVECNDRSECMIEDNRISGMRADDATGDLTRQGWGIISNFGAEAELSGPLRSCVRGDAVQAKRRQDQRDDPEERRDPHDERVLSD